MALREAIEKQGNFLFRWRSYLPIIIVLFSLFALPYSEWIERFFGSKAQAIWEIICLLISFSGLLVRCITAGYVPRGTSGRNIKSQAATELNTTGMYSVIRNPLYFGNFIIVLGILLFIGVWWLLIIGVAGFWLYYERIVFAEEEFLRKKFGDSFMSWADKTPAFWPKLSNWKKPNLDLSFRTVLRREFSTFFAIVASFTFIGVLTDLFAKKKLEIGLGWIIFFTAGLAIYYTLRTLKIKTKVLDVEGR